MPENDLQNEVAQAIRNSSHLSSRKFRYEAAEGGKITVHGTVASYFEKQLAQETIREVDGVDHINNMIQVSWSGSIATSTV